MLYIVSTPIGNLEDITFRAVRILKEVDFIACEDTRVTGVLLKHYEIKNPLISYHSHSGKTKMEKIITLLNEGKDIALVSDAGTPGISDPGYQLIRACLDENIDISPIPGPSALVTAISASGMKMNHFLYLGFIPVKKGRQTLFTNLQNKNHSVVIYESVHRLLRTLGDIMKYFGEEHEIVVGRELTKKFEEFKRGTTKEVIDYFETNTMKGEFVIIF